MITPPINSIRNIVIVGETGLGRSSLINLITGTDSAVTGNDVRGVTEKTEFYDWLNDGQTFRLWDTPGLSERSYGTVSPKQAQDAIRSLLVELCRGGGVHLLVLCMRGLPRITKGMKQTYETIVRIRDKTAPDVPLIAVFTHLEKRSAVPDILHSMDEWWTDNVAALSGYDMLFSGHACITTLPDNSHPQLPGRREGCRELVRNLILKKSLPLRTAPPKDLHVLLFGENGVGKSSLINLLAGWQIASVSPDSTPYTLDSCEYQFQLGSTTIHLWDTVGLEDPEKVPNGYIGAVEKAIQLIRRLNATGCINLFLFCIRGNRITATVQSNYRLFYEVLGRKEVPIALVVTHLEREADMEDWWQRNGRTLEKNGILSAGHACITALEGHHRCSESRDILQSLLARFDDQGKFSMPSEAWIGRILKGLGSPSETNFPKGKDLVRILTKRCNLDPDVAHRVAACIDDIEPYQTTPRSLSPSAEWTDRTASRIGRSITASMFQAASRGYAAGLSPDPAIQQDLLVEQSRVYAESGEWQDALNDANKIIKLNSSSPWGYERKCVALLGMERHDDAKVAFDRMLSKMSESRDPKIQERSRLYEQMREAISTSVKKTILHSPLVLINTLSGRLCNKSDQAAAFELTPAFPRLMLSVTTHIDHARIEQVVGEFYRYATLSHTWEGSEPLYDEVMKIVVYKLKAFPTHNKLQMFCKIARDEGFIWAWSDTCCIDKVDHFVLQEALVSMFKWYEGSAMTIIFLFDVDQLAEMGALMRSKWNSRAWTFQEYHASKVVRIYTKDWTPYLGLTIHNHKESPQIISEMEKATSISAQALVALRPGLDDVREKLRLASTRQTTRVEDAAYSLLGIFSMTLPVTYGEGDKALGRFLSQLLMSAGDTSILAWSGGSNSFNSCLPANIAVFNQPLTLHIPTAIPDAEMGKITASLHGSSLDHNLVTRLYDEVKRLPTPTFAGQRMRLPCLAFEVALLSRRRDGSGFTFRIRAGALGTMDIKTEQFFTPQDSLYLVHPWIDFLLGRRAFGKKAEIAHDENASALDDFVSFDPDQLSTSFAYEFLARLRQPFGALFLASKSNVAEYRRFSTEDLITVQVGEITSATLDELIQAVRVLDVL